MQGTARGYRGGGGGQSRPSGFEPRRGGDHCGVALCVQYARGPYRMGRGASGLRSQDPDRPTGTILHQQEAGRYQALPLACRERVRHLCLRSCEQLSIGSPGYGRCSQARREEGPSCGGRHRRRSHERRTGLRRSEQRLIESQRPADHPQRQQYVDRPLGGWHEAVSAEPEHQRDL